jgi:hypothetical protein
VLSRQLLFKAMIVALVVGSILLVINQLDALLGQAPLKVLPAILTYCVPFVVFIAGKLSGGKN